MIITENYENGEIKARNFPNLCLWRFEEMDRSVNSEAAALPRSRTFSAIREEATRQGCHGSP